MSTVEYRNIAKKYGAVSVMQDVSFSIDEGHFVVLLGPSGCGKTTLLRMTAGLEKVTRGDIMFAGQRINDVHPRDRDIAMVFQSYALYPQMKVYDNIAFSLEVRKQDPALVRQRVQEAAEILDLTPFLDRYPKTLSGGQRQRVAMGRALVRHPRVFLFDEPLSNLDAKLRAQMRYEIRRIHDRLKTTTIYVTHDQIEAMTMADDIVVMRDGNVEQMGTPDEVYDRPANMFVAEFIGSSSINFLSGQIETRNGERSIRAGGHWLPLSPGSVAAAGRSVTVGIRPSDIALDENSPLRGQIEFMENTGAERHFHIRFADEVIRAVSADRPECKVGEQVGLGISANRIHLFDEKTGIRIE